MLVLIVSKVELGEGTILRPSLLKKGKRKVPEFPDYSAQVRAAVYKRGNVPAWLDEDIEYLGPVMTGRGVLK